MGRSTFSGPLRSQDGFEIPVSTTAQLPPASSVVAGTMRMVSDNGVGNNEFCIVISTGSAWVTAVGAVLT